MMTTKATSILASVCLGVLLAGCTSSQPSFESAWYNLLARFSECSLRHGYDPEVEQNLPENRLGKGELKWRDCAYVGIEEIMIPVSAVPGLFQQLVREDKSMTSSIIKGEMTRTQRNDRVTAILNQIYSRETAQRKALEARYLEQNRQFREEMREIRRMQHLAAIRFL